MRKLIIFCALGSSAAIAGVSGPIATQPAVSALSDPIYDIALTGQKSALSATAPKFKVHPLLMPPKPTKNSNRFAPGAKPPTVTVPADTPYTQTSTYRPVGMTSVANFEGLGLGTPGFSIAGAPPDPTLAVGSTQIVQWVNTQLAVYDKTGNPLLPAPGFINGNVIWAGLPAGGLCHDFNRGDPMVQYDQIANRWILTQFAFNATRTLNAQCIAVSTTPDATGAYNLYQYDFGTALPDYAKLGVWTDAYYITYNMFDGATDAFIEGRACAYDRAAMIAGNPSATQICFGNSSRFSFLPADLDGTIPPPVGAPNYHISWDWGFLAGPPYTMQLTKFVPDFTTPANSTFNDGFGGAPFSFVGFDLGSNTLGTCNDNGNACVPQLGTANLLDTLGDRHMYRLVYRNFGKHDALLFTQSVDNAATTTADLRWWEIRNPGANPPVVYQNSTFRPSDDARWMGSAAFDKLGNIAIGYSASSATINPGIRIAGRRRADPQNELRTEAVVMQGAGSQTGTLHRWGDYTAMQIDPTDDCTFWYTNEYLAANGTFNWHTRIAAFKFGNCKLGK
ncbi:MAG: hypothetical protein PHR16_10100 [Methylovulum sp.]|nr:hypothetical protein [Methylovulum sp.]